MLFKRCKKIWKSPELFCPLERNFFVCLLISLLAFVMVRCLAKGEYSISLSLHSTWNSLSASPLIVRKTKALALRRWELNNPLMDVTKPSPAPSLCRLSQLAGNWSDFPAWPPSLSLKLRSLSGTPATMASLWLWALSLNFLPYAMEKAEISRLYQSECGVPIWLTQNVPLCVCDSVCCLRLTEIV